MERAKRIICMVLCFAMLAGYLPAPVYAEDLFQQGLCEHHPEHIDCSYAPAVDAEECDHQHGDACNMQEESCIHTHDDCGTEDIPCEHICSEDTGCITVTLNCKHKHDDECSYAETVEAVACDYVCAECRTQDDESSCDGTLECPADEHSEGCAKKANDEKSAADQAAADAVAALIDALPSLKEIQAKPREEQSADVERVNAAYDAYGKLTEEQKVLLPPAEDVFKPYFDYFSSQTEAASVEGTYNGLIWKLYSSGVLEITGTGSMELEALAAPWLAYRDQVTSVVVGEGITTIGMYAFDCFKELKTVQLPDSVDTIYYRAFYNCAKLETVNTIGTLSYIDQNAFTYCKELKTIKLDNVYYIGQMAFYGCSALNNITLYNGATKLGPSAFANCTSLTSINIPTNIKEIESNVFWGCTNLASVQLHDGITVIGQGAFENCIKLSTFEMPSCLTHIYIQAFANTALENIAIPMGITSINEYAFYDCSKLESVVIPSGVTTIGTNAFHECDALMDVYFGGTSAAWIALGATYSGTTTRTHFRVTDPAGHWLLSTKDATCGADGYHKETCVCGHERTETIPATGNHDYSEEVVAEKFSESGATCSAKATYYKSCKCGAKGTETFEVGEFGSHIFNESNRCSVCRCIGGTCGDNLTWVLDDEGTLTISGTGLMYEYTSAVDQPWNVYRDDIEAVVICDGVTSIGSYAFTECANLTSVTMADTIVSIGSRAFYDCIVLFSINLSENLTNIGNSAFGYCKAIQSIEIPDKVTSIGENAFNATSNLVEITLGNNVKTIGGWAFQSSSIAEITIPDSVTKIEQNAFMNCTKLKTILFEGNAPTFGNNAFYNVVAKGRYPVNNDTWNSNVRQQYGGDITWVAYDPNNPGEDIPEEVPESNACGDNLTWAFDASTGTLTITGTGDMYGYEDEDTPPWINFVDQITKLELPDGLTKIGYRAFSSTAIVSVTVPNSVTWIGGYAFSSCANLTSVDLGDGCGLDDGAFMYSPIKDLQLGRSNYFGIQAFTSPYLTSITITANGVEFAEGAFLNCTGLSEAHFKGTTPSIVTSKGSINPVASFRDVTWYYNCGVSDWITSSKYDAENKTWAGYKLVAEHSFVDGTCTKCGITCGTCGNAAAWEFNETTGVLTISGTGAMGNYSESATAPWYKYRGDIKTVIIEDGITSIGDYAFWYCRNMTSITIPDSVAYIGSYAFYGCSSLGSVTIPNGVTSIYGGTFYDCSSLTGVIIPDRLTTIGSSVFYGCSSLTSVIIPDSVTTMGSWVFYGCSSLISVTLPAGITKIEHNFFGNCSSLISVTIPDGVVSIASEAFKGCGSLTSVTIPDSVASIGGYAFAGCSSLTQVELPDGINEITYYLFQNCSSLTSVTIPDNVMTIGNYAFNGCTNLNNVTIPNSVTMIGRGVFEGCRSLSSIEIPNTLTTIKDSAFRNCSSLSSIVIPNCVRAIDDYTFYGCSSLSSVTIGSSVTTIGKYAFYGCSSLLNVTVPNSVTSIGGSAFSGCSDLTNITIASSVTTVGGYAFKGCTSLTRVEIPNSVAAINSYTFENCSSLSNVTIGNSVSVIDDHAFAGCSSLSSVTIPGNVATIEWRAFFACSNLDSVILLDGVISIGHDSFYDCASLVSISIPGSVTSIGENAFYNCKSLSDVYITDPSAWCKINFANSYARPMGFSDRVHILDKDGNIVTEVVLDDSVSTIPPYAFVNCSNLTSIVIPNSVTAIGDYAFKGCSDLTNVTLSDNINTIANSMFYECKSLSNLEIPDSVTSVGSYAFKGCSDLSTAVIPNSVTDIGSYAFADCSGLASLVLPDSISKIADYTFSNCSSLTSIVIPNSVTTVGSYALIGCSSLTSVSIGNGVSSIYSYAFKGCSSLTNVEIPKSVAYIGSYAFADCSNMNGMRIGEGVTFVGSHAFSGCTNLKEITFRGNAPNIAIIAFQSVNAVCRYPAQDSSWDNSRRNYGGTLTWKPYCQNDVHNYEEIVKDEYRKNIATCSAKAIYFKSCSVCGEMGTETFVYGEFAPHTSFTYIDNGDGTHKKQCSQCTYVINESHDHTDGKCVCGNKATPTVTAPTANELIYNGKAQALVTMGETNVGTMKYAMAENGTYGSIPEATNAGTYTVWYKVEGDDNYNDVVGSVPVTILPKVVTAPKIDGIEAKYRHTGEAIAPVPTAVKDGTVVIDASEYTVDYENNVAIGVATVKIVDKEGGNYTVSGSKSFQIEYALSGKCGENAYWEFDRSSGTLSITGTGAIHGHKMYHAVVNAEKNCMPWFAVRDQITDVVIDEGITEIGDCTFHGCENIRSVTIPESVTVIHGSFGWCESLTKVQLPEKLTCIGEMAFTNCTSLIEINIPSGVTEIGDYAFQNCYLLPSVTLPKTITKIGDYAFNTCRSIDIIRFSGDAPEVMKNALYNVTATAYYPAYNSTWTDAVMLNYGGNLTWVPYGVVKNRVTVDVADLAGQTSVWIDGVEYAVQTDDSGTYVDLPDSSARTMAIHTYNSTSANRYPIGMKVWMLENEEGIYTATRQEAFDDILQYSGMSIRVTGKKGIRMVTGIEQEKKNALISDGLEGFTLKEYGTAIAWASQISGTKPLVLGKSYVSSNYAYKKDVADPVFAYSGDLMQYTNVLVNFTDEQCKNDLAMRPYMILEDESGEELVIYGGIVNRSIGYIAYQNRNEFEPQTDEYNYIWNIIHYVYGDVYDDDFIHAWTPTVK